MDSREALVALNMLDGIGPVRVRQLLGTFGDAAAILKAASAESQATSSRVHSHRRDSGGALPGFYRARIL
jgi:excinuclease UvrABC nuclease subunit